jgi:hypothetical protein
MALLMKMKKHLHLLRERFDPQLLFQKGTTPCGQAANTRTGFDNKAFFRF